MSKESAIEILLKNVAKEEMGKKVMTYDMTTPIGPATPNDQSGLAEGLMETSKTTPNIQKARDRLLIQ